MYSSIMGKGKKRKAPGAPRERQPEEAPNLFERLSNKKRFDILGRKVKGETRQLGKLRTAASERVSRRRCCRRRRRCRSLLSNMLPAARSFVVWLLKEDLGKPGAP